MEDGTISTKEWGEERLPIGSKEELWPLLEDLTRHIMANMKGSYLVDPPYRAIGGIHIKHPDLNMYISKPDGTQTYRRDSTLDGKGRMRTVLWADMPKESVRTCASEISKAITVGSRYGCTIKTIRYSCKRVRTLAKVLVWSIPRLMSLYRISMHACRKLGLKDCQDALPIELLEEIDNPLGTSSISHGVLDYEERPEGAYHIRDGRVYRILKRETRGSDTPDDDDDDGRVCLKDDTLGTKKKRRKLEDGTWEERE